MILGLKSIKKSRNSYEKIIFVLIRRQILVKCFQFFRCCDEMRAFHSASLPLTTARNKILVFHKFLEIDVISNNHIFIQISSNGSYYLPNILNCVLKQYDFYSFFFRNIFITFSLHDFTKWKHHKMHTWITEPKALWDPSSYLVRLGAGCSSKADVISTNCVNKLSIESNLVKTVRISLGNCESKHGKRCHYRKVTKFMKVLLTKVRFWVGTRHDTVLTEVCLYREHILLGFNEKYENQRQFYQKKIIWWFWCQNLTSHGCSSLTSRHHSWAIVFQVECFSFVVW